MKEKCLIVGVGTYGQVYAEYLKDSYDVMGFIDDNADLIGREINGYRVLGNFDYLVESVDKNTNVFVPIGNNKVRVAMLEKLVNIGFKTPNFIHPDTNIHESVKIGKCVYILPGTYIMPLTIVNDFALISMGVNIAHHTLIEKGCFLSQGSNIGASITLGENVFCGIASTVMTGVKKVGKNATIGAGAVVIREVPDQAVIVGNPGKILKYNTA